MNKEIIYPASLCASVFFMMFNFLTAEVSKDFMVNGGAESENLMLSFTKNLAETNLIIDTNEKHEGLKSYKIENAVSTYSSLYVAITSMDAGAEYELSFWMKTRGVIPIGVTPGAKIMIQFKDLSNKILGTVLSDPVVGTTNWSEYSMSFSIPEQTHRTTVSLVLENSKGVVWFDSINIREKQLATGDVELKLGPILANDRVRAQEIYGLQPTLDTKDFVRAIYISRGDWVVGGNTMAASAASGISEFFIGDYQWVNSVFNFDMAVDSLADGEAFASYVVRHIDTSHDFRVNFNFSKNQVVVVKCRLDSSGNVINQKNISTVAHFDFSDGNLYAVKVIASDSLISCFINGKSVAAGEIDSFLDAMYGNNGFMVSNVSVKLSDMHIRGLKNSQVFTGTLY